MKKVIRLSESQLNKIVKGTVKDIINMVGYKAQSK